MLCDARLSVGVQKDLQNCPTPRFYAFFLLYVYSQIDFGVISSEMAERKLRSQRQVRVRDPKTNMLVYFSGNILCVGARSKLCAVAGMHLSARLMHNYLKYAFTEFFFKKNKVTIRRVCHRKHFVRQ